MGLNMKLNIKVLILPIGDVNHQTLRTMKIRLKKVYDSVEILEPIELTESAYNPKRGQYLSDKFLLRVKKVPGDHVLGVTEVDLYTPDLNFVFGHAELPGKAAVISLARLHSSRKEEFHSRMIKEAVHEIGHTLGLRHCGDIYCVMHFSNSLMDTDVKGEIYCGICQELLYKI
jgi:archaemetzincin